MSEINTVEVVRRRLADGRTIADADVHRLVAEIDGLRETNRRLQLRLTASGCASLAHAYQEVSDENARLRLALGLLP